MKVYVMLADGFEEAEAIIPYDILVRSKVEVQLVSVMGRLNVTSSHGIPMMAASLIEETDFSDGDMLFLPGGMPGSRTLSLCEPLADLIHEYHAAGKWLCAICAAPMVYGLMGLLNGKNATCYPGFEDKLLGANLLQQTCVRDGQFITACGAGAGFALGREMSAVLTSADNADAVLKQMMYQVYS